ncbi:MAG: hypothetical protein M1817_006154 [Caeruleum heppii]|nr:MAG: hypothetical protein M1817_006154 [Caeruleum heppii]
MAVFPLSSNTTTLASQASHADIEAWTEQAAAALHSLTVSSLTSASGNASGISHGSHSNSINARGTTVSLAIPLDEEKTRPDVLSGRPIASAGHPSSRARREPLRRDSLKRREALLKGKEGSRRRQRWENDRLLNNPHVAPPLPSDWEVHPTYPRHATVPYYLAPLWDGDMGRHESLSSRKASATNPGRRPGPTTPKVPRELRDTLKKAKAARGMLHDLETQVRQFVERWDAREKDLVDATRRRDGRGDDGRQTPGTDSEDEEIVFVGRNGAMSDERFGSPSSKKEATAKQNHETTRERDEELERETLIFESLLEDRSAAFGRWLVHSIASYYGLRTWSITVGDPARREAYVGINDVRGTGITGSAGSLPTPLWGLV